MFEIHIIPTKWGWPDLLQPIDNPIYTERETDVWNPYYPHQVRLAGFTSTYWQSNIYRERERCLKSIVSPPSEVGRIYFNLVTIQYIQRERRCLKSILSPPSEVGRIYFNLLTIPYIQRERLMFEIHIIPTKWGWPDLLQPIDNPIYTERETMFEIHSIPTKWGWPDLLQPIDNPIYTERENDVWNPYYPHQVRLARFTSTYWQSNIYRERERCLKSIVSPPSEVGRIYFNLLTIQYIQRERPMFEIHIIPTKWGWPDLLQPIDNPIYTERETDVWNPYYPHQVRLVGFTST